MRKSEVITIIEDRNVDKGYCIFKVPFELPFGQLEQLAGWCCREDLIMDITGVLENLEQLKQNLIDMKNCYDQIDGKSLNGHK